MQVTEISREQLHQYFFWSWTIHSYGDCEVEWVDSDGVYDYYCCDILQYCESIIGKQFEHMEFLSSDVIGNWEDYDTWNVANQPDWAGPPTPFGIVICRVPQGYHMSLRSMILDFVQDLDSEIDYARNEIRTYGISSVVFEMFA